MRIQRRLKTAKTMPFTVTGPGVEGKNLTSEGAAIAFALDHAARVGATFYVREYGDVIGLAESNKVGRASYRRRS